MSKDLKGNSLQIKGKVVINRSGDVFANSLSANKINIRNGGVEINGLSQFNGDVDVYGKLSGNIVSNTSSSVLLQAKQCLVSLLIQTSDNTYSIATGTMISHDGWVITSSSILKDSNKVWGTILNINDETPINIVKADGVFIDNKHCISVIKFPDIDSHAFLTWKKIEKNCTGDECYVLAAPTQTSDYRISKGNTNNITFSNHEQMYRSILCEFNDCERGYGEPIMDHNLELIGILNFKYKGLYGAINSRDACMSAQFMMTHLCDYTDQYRPLKIITKWSPVTALEIINTGLLGKHPPQGIIIDEVNDSLYQIIKVGDIITHIDNKIILNYQYYILNDMISLKNRNDTIQFTVITPPNTESRTIDVKISDFDIPSNSVRHIQLSQSQHDISYKILEPLVNTHIFQKPYVKEFEEENAKTTREIYEYAHADEIKYKKKMQLLNRLKNVKNRKKSKTRVKSRRKSRKK